MWSLFPFTCVNLFILNNRKYKKDQLAVSEKKESQIELINIRTFVERIRGGLDNQTKAISEQTRAIENQTEALIRVHLLASKAGPWAKAAVIIAGIVLAFQILEYFVKD